MKEQRKNKAKIFSFTVLSSVPHKPSGARGQARRGQRLPGFPDRKMLALCAARSRRCADQLPGR